MNRNRTPNRFPLLASRLWPALLLACLLTGSLSMPVAPVQTAPTLPAPMPVESKASIPSPDLTPAAVTFEPNSGQWPSHVLYHVRGISESMFLTKTSLVVDVGPDGVVAPLDSEKRAAFEMNFAPGPATRITASGPQLEKLNFFRGQNPANWITNVTQYSRVTYEGVHAGIDLVFYASDGKLKYDFVVKPGANPASIALTFNGLDRLQKQANGDLTLRTAVAEVHKQAPHTYQDGGPVDSSYLVSGQRVRFSVPIYDHTQTLVIDPLVYSTYHGGTSYEDGNAVASGPSDSIYVAGTTGSVNFPTTWGVYDDSCASPCGQNVFVTKFNSVASSRVYSTYIEGPSYEYANAIAVDSTGAAYITGYAEAGYPTRVGAFQTTSPGGGGAFVTKLSSTGGSLSYSTYVSGQRSSEGNGIAVDSLGYAYVAGFAAAWDSDTIKFPTTSGAYKTSFAPISYDGEAFVTKLNPTGSALTYSTLLGGVGSESARAIAIDSSGNAYVAGYTEAGTFPTTTGVVQTSSGGLKDAFLAKFNAAGSSLTYSTLLGGSANDVGHALAIDSSGNAYVTGVTASTNFPTTSGALQSTKGVYDDAFVTKLNPTATALAYSTYLGGDVGWGIAVDSAGAAAIAGSTTYSGDFVTTSNAHQSSLLGTVDAFVVHLSADGQSRQYASYLGGSGWDDAYGIAKDARDNFHVTGRTGSTNFPVTTGVVQSSPGASSGNSDAFLTKLPRRPDAPVLSVSCAVPHGVTLSWTLPYNGGNTATEYRVYRANGGTFTQIATTASTLNTDVPTYQTTPYTYKVTAVNAVGEGVASNVVSKVPCDSKIPDVIGSAVTYGWTNVAPTLTGVSWQDTYSGLSSATYTIGRSPGASDVSPTTALPTQPTLGQTGLYSPSFQPSFYIDGENYVNVQVTDQHGNTRVSNGIYVVRFSLIGPGIDWIVSATNALQDQFYNVTSVAVDWAGDVVYAPIDGYSYDFATSATAPALDTVKDVEETTSSASLGGFEDSFAQRWFRIRAVDTIGNWGPVSVFKLGIDNIQPEYESFTQVPPPVTGDPRAGVGIRFKDLDGLMDPNQLTHTDPALTVFEVDGEDVRMWEDICAPKGPLLLCHVEITEDHVLYEPLVPWQQGLHNVFLDIGDTVVDSNHALRTWEFTFLDLNENDVDQDGMPDLLEAELCSRGLTSQAIQATAVIGHECRSLVDYQPPPQGTSVDLPVGGSPGPDADGDRIPANMTIQTLRVTVNASSLVTIAPGPTTTVPLDPADDNPEIPVASPYVSERVPLLVVVHTDDDGDGVPAAVTTTYVRVTVDARTPMLVSYSLESETSEFPSEDDNDRDDVVPWSALDADGDQLPDQLEGVFCLVEDQGDSTDGTCPTTGDYQAPAGIPNPWRL